MTCAPAVFTLTLTLTLIPTLNLTLIRCAVLRTKASTGRQLPYGASGAPCDRATSACDPTRRRAEALGGDTRPPTVGAERVLPEPPAGSEYDTFLALLEESLGVDNPHGWKIKKGWPAEYDVKCNFKMRDGWSGSTTSMYAW